MDLELIYKNIEAFFITEFEDSFWSDNTSIAVTGSLKYTFEDQPFNSDPSIDESWVRVSIRPDAVQSLEKGRLGKGKRDGVIYVNVFSPRPYKRKGAIMADKLESAMKRIEIANAVQIMDPNTKYSPNRDDDWLLHLVTAPFWVEVEGGN